MDRSRISIFSYGVQLYFFSSWISYEKNKIKEYIHAHYLQEKSARFVMIGPY